jgi:hypothetical protein
MTEDVLYLDDKLQLSALLESLQLLDHQVDSAPDYLTLLTRCSQVRLRLAYLLAHSRKPPARRNELSLLAKYHESWARKLLSQEHLASQLYNSNRL